MMSEDRLGWQIRQILNAGTHDIPATTLDRLVNIRSLALARRQALPASRLAGLLQSGFGKSLQRFGTVLGRSHWGTGLASAIPAIALVLGIAFVADEQLNSRAIELAEIDSEVLADDLPLSAYLDQGFTLYVGHHPAGRAADDYSGGPNEKSDTLDGAAANSTSTSLI
ncbi:MAG: DUF3619 family protein [Burkholderiaceae bacterium]|jgi:hypothetical protein